MAYLKFFSRVFEQDFPQGCLEDRELKHLDTSFINEGLSIYEQIMRLYLSLEFVSAAELASFSTRLFKLTYILLSKLKDIPQQQKSTMYQPLPKFDFLYQLITVTLNAVNIEDVLMSTLELEDGFIKEQPYGITNKIWFLTISRATATPKTRGKITKMIRQALKCFNMIMELSVLNSQALGLPQDPNSYTSLRMFYIQNLNCVQRMTQVVLDPSQVPVHQISRSKNVDLNFSIFQQVAYYVKPHTDLVSHISPIQTLAVKFLIHSCEVWETQNEKRRSSLYLHLQNDLIRGVPAHYSFLQNFNECCNNLLDSRSLSFISTLFDLLILSTTSQHQFVHYMLKDKDQGIAGSFQMLLSQKNVGSLLNDAKTAKVRSMIQDVFAKSVIFLSQLSTKKLSSGYLKDLISQGILKSIDKEIIQEIFASRLAKNIKIQTVAEIDFEPKQLEQIKLRNDANAQVVYEHSQAFIVLHYYMNLLQSEFGKSQESKEVRIAISQFIQNQTIIDYSSNFDIDSYYREILEINDQLRNDIRDRNTEKQNDTNTHLISSGTLGAHYIGTQYTTDGSVFLADIDASSLFNTLSKTNQYSLIMNEGFIFRELAKIGQQLMINTDELIYVARTQFYDNNLLANVKATASAYNLALSFAHSFYIFSQAKADFILGIGKSRMRENIRQRSVIKSDLVLSSSLFALVSADDYSKLLTDPNILALEQNKVVKLMITMASHSYKAIESYQASSSKAIRVNSPNNIYSVKQTELDLEFLTLVLGIINSQTQNNRIDNANQAALESLIKEKILVRLSEILQQHLFFIYSHSKESSRALLLETQEQTANLYTQLVLQCFELCQFLNRQKQNQDIFAGGPFRQTGSSRDIQSDDRALVLQQEKSEKAYLNILSQVTNLMGSGRCFSQGLKIIQQAIDLIRAENFILFITRKENTPLRTIITRFVNPNVSVEESIQVIQFFISYANIAQGAINLYHEDILHTITKNTCLQRVNKEDLYRSHGEAKRNPVHILWCYVLVLIRTLNDNLIDNAEYLRSILKYISQFEPRLLSVFSLGREIQNSQSQSITRNLSLALYEEIELLTGCLTQLFSVSDKWASLNHPQYQKIKDFYIFSVPHLLSDQKNIIPSSNTEQFLSSMWMDQKLKESSSYSSTTSMTSEPFNPSTLDLRIEMSQIKSFLNFSSSMLSIFLLDKQKLGIDLLCTWGDPEYASSQLQATSQKDISQSQMTFNMGTYNRNYYEEDLMLKMTFDYYFSALEQMTAKFMLWVQNSTKLKPQYQNMTDLYNFDEWIMEEYAGLSSFLAGQQFDEFLQIFELAIQMGNQVSCLILEKLRDVFVNIKYDRQYSEIEERHITIIAKTIFEHINGFKRDMQLYLDNIQGPSVVKEQFTDTLRDFALKVKENPTLMEQ